MNHEALFERYLVGEIVTGEAAPVFRYDPAWLRVGQAGVLMSLAGVQTKLAVRITCEGAIAVPINGAASKSGA